MTVLIWDQLFSDDLFVGRGVSFGKIHACISFT